MNFSISKTAFAEATGAVDHAITSTSAQPVLRGMKIQAKKDELILTGSNADISIEKRIKATEQNNLSIVEEGTILIESKYLLDIVRKMDSEIMTVEVIDGALTRFSGDRAVYKINGMNAMDYPTIDFSRPDSCITLQCTVLKELIESTVFACALKDTRAVLTGVNFRLEDNVLKAIGTDSFRLAQKTVPLNAEGSFNVTVPAKTLNDVKSTMLENADGNVSVYLTDKKAQFDIEDMILQTRLLDGRFPEVDRLIPTSFTQKLTMNRSELIRSIDRTTFIRSENMTINRLQCSTEEVILTSKSQEIGESLENLDCVFEGDELDISFSGNYVIDAARSMKGETVTLNFSGDMKPFIIKDPDDETVIQLVLPVRTYN